MKPKTLPRPSSATGTRSLGSRSTSCEKEEAADRLTKLVPALYDTKARNFKTSLGRKKALHSLADEPDAARIETVVEEDEAETEKQTSHSQTSFKHRLHIVEDREDDFIRVGRRSVPLAKQNARSRSTELQALPNVTESREEDLFDRQKKLIFGSKFQALLDRSEQQPNSQKHDGKRNSMVAIDCLTIEEEQPEDAAVAEVDLLSNDAESGRFSTPRSRSLQHLRVDEVSADEEKKRKKFEQQIEEVIEERPTEEEDGMPEAQRRNRHVRDNLVKIVLSEMVCPQDSELLKIIDPKDPAPQPILEEEISEEGIEDPADAGTDTGCN